MNRIIFLFFFISATSAQTIVHSFDGDKGPGLAACQAEGIRCDRPEMDVAVNGRQVVQVTWQSVRVYDYGGRLVKSTPMTAFITQAGLSPEAHGGQGPIEPHVVYDEFIERWIITVTCLNDCVMVSASADPAGSWGGVYLSCLDRGPCLNRDPGLKLGYDRNGVYICGGHGGDENAQTVPSVAYDCFALPHQEVPAITKGKPPAHLNRSHNMPLDVVPAVDHNPNKAAGAPAFFANKSCAHTAPNACQQSTNFSFHWLVNTFTWQGPAGVYGAQQAVKTDIGSTQNKWLYNTPCCGPLFSIPQAGSAVTLRAAGSHRVMNVFQTGTHLHGVLGSGPCTTACGSQGQDANNLMIWVDLDCSKPQACVVSQTAKISGDSFHPEFGTVGVDAAGNVGIVATSSTASSNLGILLWTRRAADPPNTFRGPVTVIKGTQPYTCLNQRSMVPMGSATGTLTALDPDGKTLWATEQWANDATPCVWNTRIVGYQVGTPAADGAEKRAAAHLASHCQAPEEYVAAKFRDHDIVFLGQHPLKGRP